MKPQRVVSSNVSWVGYEDGVLLVGFVSGSAYSYQNVTIEMFNDLVSSRSKGSWVRMMLVGDPNYPCARLSARDILEIERTL